MPNGTFTVTITGLAQLTAAFQQYPTVALPFLQRALAQSWAILAQNTTTKTVPFRTGFLLQSFGGMVSGLTATWGPDVMYKTSYSRFVEFGTAPHDIFPKDKKALFWEGALHPVAVVHHPGTKRNDYMGRIVQASQEQINEMFGTALQQIVEAIAAKA
jgi:hypothetical protein